MTVLHAILLGIVQGLTEFFPISSSGHLVVIQHFFGLKQDMLAFDIVVHWGTLLAVLIYFWKDILRLMADTLLFFVKFPFKRSTEPIFRAHPFAVPGCFILLSTAATGIIAMVFREGFESLFGSVISVGICWLITGVFLLLSRRFQNGDRTLLEMNHQDSFVIGLVQGFAIMPGISRSGATVITGMAMGLEKEDAARYSFFLAIPAILGAGFLEFHSAVALLTQYPVAVCSGFCAAAVSGYLGILFLLRLIRSGKFFIFGFYCLTAALLVLIYGLVRLSIS